jgi:hypothetical protein
LPRIAPLGVLAAGVALYLFTMAPTVLWGDDAELQRIVVTGEPRVTGQSSGASHLLWLAIARPFVRWSAWLPLDSAGRTTLITALFGAVALALVFAAARELARSLGLPATAAGLAAAAALGLSHTFWLLAVRPDVYTLQTALLATAIWCTLRWRGAGAQFSVLSAQSGGRRHVAPVVFLLAAGVMVAAALANHAMILASTPGLAVLALALPGAQRRQALIGLAAVATAVALAVLVAAGVGVPLGELLRTLRSVHPVLPGPRDLLPVPLYLLYQYPLSLLLALPGVMVLWRRDRGALLGLLLLYAGNIALPLLIRLPDRFQFFLPSYVPVALVIGVGAAAIWHAPRTTHDVTQRSIALPLVPFVLRAPSLRWAVAAALAAPLVVYPVAAATGSTLAARLAPARTLPGRDPVAFYLWPAKTGYAGARYYGEAAFATLAPQAVIVADWLPYQTLRYLQAIEGRRPDVTLANVNAGGGAQLAFLLAQNVQRPLYIADDSPAPYYEMAEIERCFTVQREGVVYRLDRRGSACG